MSIGWLRSQTSIPICLQACRKLKARCSADWALRGGHPRVLRPRAKLMASPKCSCTPCHVSTGTDLELLQCTFLRRHVGRLCRVCMNVPLSAMLALNCSRGNSASHHTPCLIASRSRSLRLLLRILMANATAELTRRAHCHQPLPLIPCLGTAAEGATCQLSSSRTCSGGHKYAEPRAVAIKKNGVEA